MTQITAEKTSVAEIGRRARAASLEMSKLSHDVRNDALLAIAHALEAASEKILGANQKDCRAAEPLVATGKLSSAMFARLKVDEKGIRELAMRVRDVVRLPDPLGRRLAVTELDEGLTLYKETCPLGVIGIVFEARPDVVPQVASLTLKSGNAVILKGGSEAAFTNEALVTVWREALRNFHAVPEDSIQLLHTRADVMELLTLSHDVDLIVPRGSKELVEHVMQNSRIPVLGHGEGICHVYVDRAADMEKAVRVTLDSKVQNPSVCNAAETLLVDEKIAGEFLPKVAHELQEANVQIRGCAKSLAILGRSIAVPAQEQDWSTEYCDLILSVKVVRDAEEAIAHVNRFGSRHTDTIVTEDMGTAKKFLDEVDSAGVFVNASTRFSDGFRYGLGAEIGISNGKLHARGPVGLEGLTTYKYKLIGNGHIVGEYSSGAKHFKHRQLPIS
ncbi:MAG: glutamate-5-semialdehyde dehydrogenase [Acidobacteria bacterium RIFCSPLOWO2_12_FULL_54_10]|nr:MAG: glutamate-5-semialdehyde dehydrogenase [Acidobacteria bacterium RIFCSPLOWO2_12_FULL_54_10]